MSIESLHREIRIAAFENVKRDEHRMVDRVYFRPFLRDMHAKACISVNGQPDSRSVEQNLKSEISNLKFRLRRLRITNGSIYDGLRVAEPRDRVVPDVRSSIFINEFPNEVTPIEKSIHLD